MSHEKMLTAAQARAERIIDDCQIISLSEDEADVEELDCALERLYDWGDYVMSRRTRLCWINK